VPPRWGLVIHTGAGTFTLESLGERQAAMRTAIGEALAAGHRILEDGGSSVDAVEKAVVVLEDSPHFNAGHGAVFTHDGTHELDAAVMDGRTMMAGAVAAVRRVKNPIRLARRVMERSPHVLLVGEGAEAFGRAQEGIEFVDERYFRTELRWEQLQRALKGEAEEDLYFGTVGAVALDRQGDLAAATSTGGTTNKRAGRVGDSPIIGAGTYASNTCCAISATGLGEYFIRYTVAKDVCARVEYGGIAAQAAADEVIHGVLRRAGGHGGVVGLDRRGAVIMSFNTSGMGRGYMGADGQPTIRLVVDQ
jgi:beta-aspartyl-peptidase (threonine type)